MSKVHNKSWVDLLDSSNSSNSGDASTLQLPDIIVEECEVNTSQKNTSRELEIEFVDSENEKKFDKLLTENKIKSPFKRRLSNEKLNVSGEKNDHADKKSKLEHGESPQKRFRTESSGTDGSSNGSSFVTREYETDKGILDRRQKQIDYGKNTVGYDNYVKAVPKHLRTREHPKTPPKQLTYSRRAWEGLIKSWRKKLHSYDPASEEIKTEIESESNTQEVKLEFMHKVKPEDCSDDDCQD